MFIVNNSGHVLVMDGRQFSSEIGLKLALFLAYKMANREPTQVAEGWPLLFFVLFACT